MQTVPKLPGVYFENLPGPIAPELVRMDISAFVGFASSGPLHVPVLVEDFARFREIFGPDIELAWDEERGRSAFSHLGPAVKAFFRNGGRRCWVVRVAGNDAVRHEYTLPNLVTVDETPATVRARAVGSWIEDLRVGTRLQGEFLPHSESAPLQVTGDGLLAADTNVLASPPVPGDLLEIGLQGEDRRLFLFVDRSSSQAFAGRFVFWSQPGLITPVDVASFFGSPNKITTLRQLRLELLVWRENRLIARFADLAFSQRHPRFWARLPTDDELFRHPQGRRTPRIPEEERQLLAVAGHPRFPLAGPASPADLYLPLAMPESAGPEAAQALGKLQGTRLERDGLSRFSWRLFLDGPLSRVGSGALLKEAENHYYVRRRNLEGIHSLLPVEEVTLVSVPDAIHRGWTRDVAPASDLLSAPVLYPPDELKGARRYWLQWTIVERATSYLLQVSSNPDFEDAAVLYEGSETETDQSLPNDCLNLVYVRVRAFRFGQPGPWSNTRMVLETDFLQCSGPVLENPVLHLHASESVNRLVWTIAGKSDASPMGLPEALEFELEMDSESGFLSPRLLFRGIAGEYPIAPLEAGVHYFRVRGRRGESLGPWSNTLIQQETTAGDWRLSPLSKTDGRASPVLLGIHRSLLRFCAARADLMAVLNLPRHFERRQVENYLAALASEYSGQDGSETSVFSHDGPPPLTPGEHGVFSYGALYHPWIASVSERTPGPGSQPGLVDFSPPDGVVCGLLARQALQEGAWIAPANKSLQAVVSLEPPFTLEDWTLAKRLEVNLILQRTRGFLTLSARTLSRDTNLQWIHVRRLLILLRKEALRAGAGYVFEPHSAEFRRVVRHRFEMLLSNLFVRGAFAGTNADEAYRVVADESVNPPQNVELGRLVVELRVAPAQPLRFLRVRLLQTGPENLAIKEISQ